MVRIRKYHSLQFYPDIIGKEKKGFLKEGYQFPGQHRESYSARKIYVKRKGADLLQKIFEN